MADTTNDIWNDNDGEDVYKRQGHNGSGKSTLAKTLNGVLLPCGGHVYVEGMDTLDEQDVYKRQAMTSTAPGIPTRTSTHPCMRPPAPRPRAEAASPIAYLSLIHILPMVGAYASRQSRRA